MFKYFAKVSYTIYNFIQEQQQVVTTVVKDTGQNSGLVNTGNHGLKLQLAFFEKLFN